MIEESAYVVRDRLIILWLNTRVIVVLNLLNTAISLALSLEPRLAFTFFSAQKVNKKTPNPKNSLMHYGSFSIFYIIRSSCFPDFILTR